MSDQEIGELKGDVKHILLGINRIEESVKELTEKHAVNDKRILTLETEKRTTLALIMGAGALIWEGLKTFVVK